MTRRGGWLLALLMWWLLYATVCIGECWGLQARFVWSVWLGTRRMQLYVYSSQHFCIVEILAVPEGRGGAGWIIKWGGRAGCRLICFHCAICLPYKTCIVYNVCMGPAHLQRVG
jgi:hypothetical protein